MEGTWCRLSHRAQHPQEGDSRGGGCPGCTWPRPASAPCGGGAAGRPRGQSRGGSRRCARTARGRGRGRRARPAPAARTRAPWPPHDPAAAPARRKRRRWIGRSGPGARACRQRVTIGQSSGAARADWRAKAGGRGKAAGLGRGEDAVPLEGPSGHLPAAIPVPAPCAPRRRVSVGTATLPRHRELPAAGAGQSSEPPPCCLPGVQVSLCPRGASLLPPPAQGSAQWGSACPGCEKSGCDSCQSNSMCLCGQCG